MAMRFNRGRIACLYSICSDSSNVFRTPPAQLRLEDRLFAAAFWFFEESAAQPCHSKERLQK
jgi:hypothetical protein